MKVRVLLLYIVFEIAEQKATEVKVDAVQHGYPLEVKVENA